ncbi:MAG: ATP-binding cassette domain-containing protein [Treponema sp.]|jgi:energy-coupling factor transport system ATP-binding protein|nr:ATP-binding cassette domain-containing protein [Treponema sp.]
MEARRILEIRDLSFTYGGASSPALRNVGFRMYAGERTALLGANGSGKSTLLNCINGLCRPEAGAVSVYDKEGNIFDPSEAADLGTIRRMIGTVLQNPDDQIVSTVVEADAAFGPENMNLPRSEVSARVGKALAAAGLEAFRGTPPHFLSGGGRQRLAIAGVLAMEGEALVLDEALSMIDPLARESLLSLMDSLARNGKTILQVTHSLEEAFRCSRCIVLDKGRLAFDGKPLDLLRAPELEDWGFRLSGPVKSIRMLIEKYPDVAVSSLDPGETAAAIRALRPQGRAEPPKRAVKTEEKAGASGRNPPGSAAGAPENSARAESGAPKASDPAVLFEGVSHHYLAGTAFAAEGLRDLNLRIPENSTVALIGKSGSGKTTLLKHINALLLPSAGTVRVLGRDTLDKKTDLRSLRFAAALAVQHPESALFETRAADDAAYGPRNAGLRGGALVARVREAMDEAGLPLDEYGERESRALSGGEKRRLALAGVLAMDSKILLLDEPLASLDGKNRERVLALIKEQKKKGKTVIVSTHSMETAAAFDFVAVMDQGRIAAFGTPQTVFGPHWDERWGLALPWTVCVARELGTDAVPLDACALASLVEGTFGEEDAQAGCEEDAHRVAVVSPPAGREEDAQAGCAAPAGTPAPVPAAESRGKRRKTGGEFFRNMTFGQFLDRPSPLRNCGAGKKLLMLLILAVTAIAGPNPLFPLGVLLFTVIAGTAAGKVEPKHLLRGFIPAFPYLALFALFQVIFTWAGDISAAVVSLGPVSITKDELVRSALLISQLGALMTLLSLYTAVTPLRETLAAFDRALNPLSRIGLPARDISLIIGIALRFIPVLTEEAECIINAQLSRGGRGGLRSAPGMIVPLFLRALERSETLAKAMVLRLYHL